MQNAAPCYLLRCAFSLRVRRLFIFLFASCAVLQAQDVIFNIDAMHDRNSIPEDVYGVNDSGIAGATVHRHGGNRLTGFNWENNASNAGTDYLNSSDSFLGSNAGIGNSQTSGALLQAWLNADRAAALKTIMTIPLAGYVAADMNGTVTQAQTAPSSRWKQLVTNKGAPLSLTPDTSDGVVYLDEMVNFLLVKYGTATNGGVSAYCLDNEPALWPSTHPRIHPGATGYAELVSRHVPVATMITGLDPSARIYGPVGYGWNEHLNLQNAPDFSGFNSTYGTFTNYYLAQIHSASDAVGRRLLHRYDLHWYPEARGDNRIVFGSSPGTNNDIDARLQAPRSLWDSTYIETSWITQYTTNGQGIRLLPRLKESVDQYFPGTGLAITEYNYGASDHISGGVAEADVLGILGRYQVAACFWPLQSNNSYVAGAFQLYRNYDGAGATFGSISLDATASANSLAGIHAARIGPDTLTIVVINRSRTQARTASFQFGLTSGINLSALRAFHLTAASTQVQSVPNPPSFSATAFSDLLPAMSATLYEIALNATSFAGWQQQQFGADAWSPIIAGPLADPDSDSVPNLLEYITARDPKSPEKSIVLVATVVTQNNLRLLQLEFQRRKNANDVQLFLQTSPDAIAWSDVEPTSLNPTVESISPQSECWTIVLPFPAGGRFFYRLKATQ